MADRFFIAAPLGAPVKIGLVGKPNVGKSTFYAAATLVDAEIANYPFTTIEANRGMAFVRTPDPGPELGVTSTPRTGKVVGATRYVPVEVIDVAGLVPGAHEGRGLGNKFLGDLSRADALIHVVDASGTTDAEGNPIAGGHDPLADVAFLENEIDQWICGLLADGWDRVARRVQQEGLRIDLAIVERLNGIGVDQKAAKIALRDAGMLGVAPGDLGVDRLIELASAVRKASKPMIVALNKVDLVSPERLAELEAAIDGPTVRVSAQSEMALGKGAAAGVLEYTAGASSFGLKADLSRAQQKGLDYIQNQVLDRFGSTGVHDALEYATFTLLGLIPAFPVEDDHHLTDKEGRVLPDCHLVPPGTTAKDLAYRVHTDLGDHFIRGVDCRTKRTIGAEHELLAGDVIKIAANA